MVRHATNNVWETPEFVTAVKNAGRSHLIMAGVAADVGLGLTAIAARKAGYRVYVIADASGAINLRIEQTAWLRMTQAGITLTSWSGFTGEIQRNYLNDPGPQLQKILGENLTTGTSPFGA